MVNPRQKIRTTSSRCGGPRCELEMRVMMVVRGVDIVGVIAMRTTTLREPTTVVRIPVRIPFRIPPEIQFFFAMRTTLFRVPTAPGGMPGWMIHERGPWCVDEDLSKNNRGPMKKRVSPSGSLPQDTPPSHLGGRRT